MQVPRMKHGTWIFIGLELRGQGKNQPCSALFASLAYNLAGLPWQPRSIPTNG
jgi:hypothetical protein